MDNNLPLGRREVIARRLDEGQAVVANVLAAEFDVSEDVIRRDLRNLAAEGRCRRVYGGALPLSAPSTPINQRIGESEERKHALAAVAVSLIAPGEMIFIDSGSTNLALVPLLPDGIAVVTNSVVIAGALQARGTIATYMIGGKVDAQVGGCVDAGAVQALGQFNIDRAFLGACAVSGEEGIGAFYADDAAFKRAAIEVSRHSVVMATSDKLDSRTHFRIAPLDRITHLVLEHDAAALAPALMAQIGQRVILARPPA